MVLPYVLFVVLYVGSISSFRNLSTGSQVFALLKLFLCVILHTMSSGRSLQLLCILPFGMLCQGSYIPGNESFLYTHANALKDGRLVLQ